MLRSFSAFFYALNYWSLHIVKKIISFLLRRRKRRRKKTKSDNMGANDIKISLKMIVEYRKKYYECRQIKMFHK